MRRIVLFLLSFLLIENVVALRSGKFCFNACDLNINYISFNDTDPSLSKKIRSCRSEARITSLYLCVEEYCEDGARDEWLEEQNDACERLAGVTLPGYEDVVSKYGPDERGRIRRLGADEALGFPTLNEIVIPDFKFFERAFTTLDAAYFEVDIHWVYGWAMYYFWIVVIGVGIANRLISLIRNLRQHEWQPIAGSEPVLGMPPSPKAHSIFSLPKTLLKRYITVPAAFGSRCSQPLGWCTIPPRIQSLTIFSFVFMNIVLCSISYRITHGNLYWPDEYIQLWRYVSDRTGVISLANFPLIWLFGTRNNVLMWLTGWGFGAYNNFHRWVARVSTAQAIIHSIGYTVMIHERGGWALVAKYFHKHYFWNGELATIFMCALLAFSVYGLRRSHYEIFLITHIVFSIIVLWTMYYHVEIFISGEWNIFIYPCLFIWIFDRLLRGLRTLAYDRCFWNTKATATYDANSKLVRLEVPYDKSFYKAKPGTYYYIYLLNDFLYAHQNHPFTLAYVTTDKEQDVPLSPVRPLPRRVDSDDSGESDALLSPGSSSSSSSSSTPKLVFLIRPYDGFTSRLAKRAAKSLHATSLRVLIEGPYGHTIPLRNFPNILFMVGGTGIAVPLSHISNLLSSHSSVTNLRIVWAVREHAFLYSILREFRALLEDERVTVEVHVTQDEECKDDAFVLGERMKNVKVEVGRPDVYASVEDAAREAGQQALAVIACGPAQMADQARKASVQVLAKGFRGVEYFEESFKW